MPAPIQFTLESPESTPFSSGPGFIAVSPDGQYIAYTSGEQASGTQLSLRSVGTLDIRPVPAAINAWQVAWSPDGESIVYTQAGGQSGLRRLDLAGGPARTLSDVAAGFPPAWSREGAVHACRRTSAIDAYPRDGRPGSSCHRTQRR